MQGLRPYEEENMQAQLKGKLKELAEQNIVEGESIEFAILGTPKQAIVALQDRLLIIKHGFRAAAVFGGKVTSIDYRDVTGVEVKKNMATGIIEISSPGYQAKGGTGYWPANRYSSPHALENTIPISRRNIDMQQDAINALRTKIKDAKQEQRAPSEAGREGGIAAELERLAALKVQGALTDEEFERAKERLLS
jgi:hypothetical protein